MAGRLTPQDVIQDPKNQQPDLIPKLITQQLAMLDDRKFLWVGQVWPGQNMEWMVNFAPPAAPRPDMRVNEEAAQKQPNAAFLAHVVSELKLTLPKLGKLVAQVSVHQGAVGIRIHAEAPETLELLDQSKQRLSDAMFANGQHLSQLEVDLL
jgi:hypothetical protein